MILYWEGGEIIQDNFDLLIQLLNIEYELYSNMKMK